MRQDFQACIEACQACALECEDADTSGLNEADGYARVILRDCADICLLAIRCMARESTFVAEICELCARVCDACAAECDRLQDARCQRCAEVCRKCAAECRKVAQTALA